MHYFILDGSAKGYFDLLSSCTGHPLWLCKIIRYSTFFSLKKKELFNVKEAHNHSFSHAVRGFLMFLTSLVNGAQTANWGWYYFRSD